MQATLTTTTETQVDLFGNPITTSVRAHSAALVSKAGKTTGVRIGFDATSFKDFKTQLAASDLNAEAKKLKRQEFLSADSIKQRQMLGMLALQRAYEKDDFAPMGRVPEVMELRKSGVLKLVSVSEVLGVRPETDKQKLAKLEAEAAALRSQIASMKAEREAQETEAVIISEES